MKIPFGLRITDQRMVAPDEVDNGARCGCVCPECAVELVAKQGNFKDWHFAHASGSDCPGAFESSLHKMAKQMVRERREIRVPTRVRQKEAKGVRDPTDGRYPRRPPKFPQ